MGDPATKATPAAARKRQNPAHTDLTTFFFVEHDKFELLGGPWGSSDRHKKGIDLGPRTLDADKEFWPWASPELQKARSDNALAKYLAKHELTDRWVYAFSIEDGGSPVLQYEIRLDAKGRVAYLPRDGFLALHADAKIDDEDDATYLGHAEWKATKDKFFRQKIPIGKAGAPIRWHFFGMGIRMTKPGAEAIEGDAALLSPDPGFNFFAKDKSASKVEGVKVLKRGSLVPVGDGVLARVFDPMTVVDNLRKDLHAELDRFIRYATPVAGDPDVQVRQARHLVNAIANHANLVCDKSALVDIRHKELSRGSDVWDDLRLRCFTKSERALLDKEKVTASAYDSPTFFLEMERRLRETLLRAQIKAGTALMLWLSSHPWAFVEQQYWSSTIRGNRQGHRVLRVSAEALQRLGELDAGRHFLSLLIEQCESKPGVAGIPNQPTVERFTLRDKPEPKGALDTTAIAIKAGKAPFTLWSKLLTLVTTMNKTFLEDLLTKHKPNLDPKVVKLLESLPSQKRVFSAAALIMTRRIRNVYRLNIVQPNLTAFDLPNGHRGVLFYLPDGSSKAAAKPTIFALLPGDDLDAEIALIHKKIGLKELPEPGGRLTFDHVTQITSALGLFFSVRDLYISGTEKGALDTTKSAFNVLKSIYGLPWVQKKVSARITEVSLKQLTGELAGEAAEAAAAKMAAKGVAKIGFVIQIVTVGFAVHDTWSKAQTGTSDVVLGSALSLASEVLLTISAGLVLASGGTMTPAAAVLAGAAAVIATAQFIYTTFRPDEHVYAVRFCLFGSEFKAETGVAVSDARHWQACLGHDLRHYNPSHKGHRLLALQNQIAGFNNLMHGFGAQMVFDTAVSTTGSTLKIFPGAVPRQAYFEIKIAMSWWRSRAGGTLFSGPKDTWENTFYYRYYPFADNVPTPAGGAPEIHALARLGVGAPEGGPFGVIVTRNAGGFELYTYPKKGRWTSWSGSLNNTIAGSSVPVKIRKRFAAKYKMSSHLVNVAPQQNDLHITIELLPGASEDLQFTGGSFDVVVAVPQDSPIPAYRTIHVKPVMKKSVAGNGNPIVEFTIPGGAPGTADEGTYQEFTFLPRLGDKRQPDLGEYDGMKTNRVPVGAEVKVESTQTTPLSPDTYHYRIDYRARFVNTGDGTSVFFEATKAFVRRSSEDPSKGYMTKDLHIQAATVQYVRNEGAGEPYEEGTRAKYLWQSMERLEVNEPSFFTPLVSRSKHAAPLEIKDRAAVRFTLLVTDKGGNERWTGSDDDWVEDKVVKWSYAVQKQWVAFEDTHLIKSATATVRLVLDGDERTRNFNPNDITRSDRKAHTEVKLDPSPLTVSWSPPMHSSLAGVNESDVKRSILDCKV